MKTTKPKTAPMSGAKYQEAIDALGLTQVGAARFLRIGPRTSRRWIANETKIPHGIALLLTLMIAKRIKPKDLEQ